MEICGARRGVIWAKATFKAYIKCIYQVAPRVIIGISWCEEKANKYKKTVIIIEYKTARKLWWIFSFRKRSIDIIIVVIRPWCRLYRFDRIHICLTAWVILFLCWLMSPCMRVSGYWINICHVISIHTLIYITVDVIIFCCSIRTVNKPKSVSLTK